MDKTYGYLHIREAAGFGPPGADCAAPSADATRESVATDEVRQGLVRWVGNAVDKYGSKTLGEVLDELGYDRTPPFDRLAELTWPTWCAFMQAPPVMAFVDGVVDEMVDVWTNGA